MSKLKRRKPKPSVPYYVWLSLDNCYCCKNRNNCGNCKILKQYKKIDIKNKSKEIEEY